MNEKLSAKPCVTPFAHVRERKVLLPYNGTPAFSNISRVSMENDGLLHTITAAYSYRHSEHNQ